MPTNVLVAYGTTNGSTAEIAETIAEVLRKDGLTVDALPARSVPSAAAYDAVVVGGGLYAGRWHKDARRFVRRHGKALAERDAGRAVGSHGELRTNPQARAVQAVAVQIAARAEGDAGGQRRGEQLGGRGRGVRAARVRRLIDHQLVTTDVHGVHVPFDMGDVPRVHVRCL